MPDRYAAVRHPSFPSCPPLPNFRVFRAYCEEHTGSVSEGRFLGFFFFVCFSRDRVERTERCRRKRRDAERWEMSGVRADCLFPLLLLPYRCQATAVDRGGRIPVAMREARVHAHCARSRGSPKSLVWWSRVMSRERPSARTWVGEGRRAFLSGGVDGPAGVPVARSGTFAPQGTDITRSLGVAPTTGRLAAGVLYFLAVIRPPPSGGLRSTILPLGV